MALSTLRGQVLYLDTRTIERHRLSAGELADPVLGLDSPGGRLYTSLVNDRHTGTKLYEDVLLPEGSRVLGRSLS